MTENNSASDRKQRLRERLEQSRTDFLAAVEPLTADDLTRSAGHDSDWTAKDLIGHVAYAEASMLSLIQGALTGQAHQQPADFDLNRWNESRVRRAREQSVEQLLARLEVSRQETWSILDQISEADLDRPASHPVAKGTTVEGIFRVIARHERDHARELRAVHERAPVAPD